MARGYYGIAVYLPKTGVNVGTLWRSAHVFGASFLATIGHRYRRQPSDVTNASQHVPLWNYADFEDFRHHLAQNCACVVVEIRPDARPIKNFVHPERAVYILGPEDGSVPDDIAARYTVVQLPGDHCLNVAVAGSIVMYDRISKNGHD